MSDCPHMGLRRDCPVCNRPDSNPPKNAAYWKRRATAAEARVADLEDELAKVREVGTRIAFEKFDGRGEINSLLARVAELEAAINANPFYSDVVTERDALRARVAELEAEAVIAQNNFLDAKIRCAELEVAIAEHKTVVQDTLGSGEPIDHHLWSVLDPKP